MVWTSLFKSQMLRSVSNKLTAFPTRSHVGSTASSNSWTTILPALARFDSIGVLRSAVELINDGDKPDASPLVHLLRVSGNHGYVSLCQQLHGYVIKHGFVSDTRLSNSLMRFYKTSDSLEDAHKVFDEMPYPDVISWNSLVSGYVQSGRFQEGLSLFLELHRSDVFPNEFSFTAALAACSRLRLLLLGACIHSKTVKLGLEKGNVVVGNCLIDMYGKCGSMDDAVLVFQHMEEKDTVSWNAIVASCSRNCKLQLGLWFFHQMPNPDTVTYNELIDAFVKSGDFNNAFQVLSDMPNPNSSSWNTILTGYVNSEQSGEATELFKKMHSLGVRLDEYSLSIFLAAIATLAVVPWGSLMHSCALKLGLDSRVVVASALIDMYSKCGMLKHAELIFCKMPRKNLTAWNAMISGYARNGDSTEAIKLFNQLKQERFMKPDRFTFLNLLAVCSHCEVPMEVTVGFFEMMVNEYGIKPSIEHCCSLIRAMGQTGEVWQAKKVIQDFGFGYDSVAWRALLGACSVRKDLKAAKIVAAKMIELGEADEDEYVYIVMSNLYAYHERWREVSQIRKIMREKGVKKEVGSSWIQEQNVAIQL
ncbi:PREDICTED: putative pentatricopeptide repeat-containing protein At5g47460 [Camelina sativa]|uniref:Pentatricopeptide repeat-containing protein At5g47460 n=1 Tax=Camelina sativa TaxID=90675 RepID=A0ABM0Y5E6_CAMSA|nr:PREDICTED: putative pentatricopeptide repeat-containing protein At5g47460 [Camelina sativa]